MQPKLFGSIDYPRRRLRSRESVAQDIQTLLDELRSQCGKGLHLGAGASKIPGLINCDLFNPEADEQVDATDLGVFADESIDLIEAHHMIEHLSFDQLDKALPEWHRVLRPSGLLVLTCPDVLWICRQWVYYSVVTRFKPCPDKFDYMAKMLVGSQEHEGMFHKNAFDFRRLMRILAKFGFSVEFRHTPYPIRPTPSLLVIARKVN